jgi:hypothetical protein
VIINPGVPPVDEAPDQPEQGPVPEFGLDAARAIAAEMDAAEERWYVMYGAGSRSYWAFPLWDPGLPMVLESASPVRLVDAMRETEVKYAARRAAEAS